MQEKERLDRLFADLYDGHPWIGVNLMDTLGRLTAEEAHQHPFPQCNSIWEILNHLIAWRLNVMKRLGGSTPVTPENNYVIPVEDTSDAAWKDTLEELAVTQENWHRLLHDFDPGSFGKIYPPNKMSYYEHIHGIIQHDAYHLGQIVILAKEVRQDEIRVF